MFNLEKCSSELELGAEKQEEKSEARKKLEKKLRAMTVWGVVTLSTLGMFKAFKEYKPDYKYKPKTLIAYVEKEKPLTVIEKIELKKKIDYLREQFSDRIIPLLQKSVEVDKESVQEPIKIRGFEKAGLSNEDLKKLWSEKYYPKGWLDEEIGEVEYRGRTKEKKLSHYSLKESEYYGGTHEPLEGGRSKITFFWPQSFILENQAEWKDFVNTLDWYFSHEASHANDWEAESGIGFKQRIEFLYEITQNCFRKGAYRDALGYIESIKNPNSYKERYYKVREYWAVSCDRYFAMPEIFKELYSYEFGMVDKYVKKEDLTFDPFEKVRQRQELIEDIIEESK